MAKRETVFNRAWKRRLLPLIGVFPISPNKGELDEQGLRTVYQVLERDGVILIFPEGKRSDAGEINQFRAGIGMMASRLDVAVVPVRLEGLDRILHHTAQLPTRGRARCAFGAAMSLRGHDYAALAAQVEEAVRAL